MTKITFLKTFLFALTLLGSNVLWGQGTLPFNFSGSGGSSSIATTTGMSQNGIGTDYAASNSPYLIKFDGTGDYIIINFDSPASTVSIGVKMVGGASTSSIAIQGSLDGSSYSLIETMTISGAQNAIINFATTNGINSDFRYIKLLYTKGSNVGLGSISITKAAISTNTVSTPTISATGALNSTDNYFNTASITLSSTTAGAEIRYTTNGDTPTASSTLYSAPFDITNTTTIKAIAIKSGLDNSSVASKTITITTVSAPTITVTQVTVPDMTAVTGLTDSEVLTVTGAALTANVAITIDGTNASMFSVAPESVTNSNGSASGSVTVTYSPTAPGTHTATLRFNSTGATEVTRTLNGTSSMTIPVATDASGISTSGFTANWNAVAGASEYELSVYTKSLGGSPTTQTENFDGITPDIEGKIINAATYLSGWSANSQSTTRQVYTTATNFGTTSPSLAFTTTGDYIETATFASPIQVLSFWAKQQSGATSSTLIEGYNGSTWITIATLSNADVATSGTKTYDLISLGKTNVVKIKISYTKVLGNLSIDDVAVTYGGSANLPIAGSPFTVTGSTSKVITGLAENTTYYYKVIAKNGSTVTAASNEMSVITSNSTGLNNTIQNLQLRTINGNIVFNTTAGKLVNVYNSVGQKVSTAITTEGNNTIPARVRGVVFVKIGYEISKLIVE